MALNLGDDVLFSGPALPEAFVRHELEKLLGTHLPKPKAVQGEWEKYRKELRKPLTLQSGRFRVKNLVLDPLAELLGYETKPGGDPVRTREGLEGPGLLWQQNQVRIRVFPSDYQADLDAPAEKGLTYRHTPQRIAERILLAAGERVGLLTNGDELRFLLSDPARPVSFISFRLNAWRILSPRDLPDDFRLLLAFLDPKLLVRQGERGEKPSKLEALLDAARLKQGQITKDLRSQARKAVEQFIQGVLDHPANHERFAALSAEERERLPRQLWREALILIYRLLFILRGESSGVFRFATTSPWRHTYSPGSALAEVARQLLDKGADTGNYLEQGLRKLFAIFEHGLRWTEATIVPLGGRLFGREETPLLAECAWSEVGCAQILDNLLWTLEKPKGARNVKEGAGRRRINYADLDVEDLGRVYEALLELEPGLATEPMVRLKRAKLEVVVPASQGQKYRPAKSSASAEQESIQDESEDAEEAEETEEEGSGKKSKVEFVEEITPEAGSPGQFYLRVGLGRKSSGSFYTPDSFVRFLVQATLQPHVEERSPAADPQPREILKLKVLDPAMGSAHFLVGVCRFLGERLYEACRACADKGLWDRIPVEVVPYLPGRVQEGEAEVGVSADRARAICKRLVAVNCLYGVDKNELAVELAKVCLWLESQAEGMPLTFLDHRLVHGDSLTGPFWNQLTTYPVESGPVRGLFAQGVEEKFGQRLAAVLTKVKWLEQNVGSTPDEITEKQKLKAEIDTELFPFRVLAMAWSGAVMLGEKRCDGLYEGLLKQVAEQGNLPETLDADVLPMLRRGTGMEKLPTGRQELLQAISGARGGATSGPALSFDLTFPEVFYPTGVFRERQGFHVVLGNPPWDKLRVETKAVYAVFDPTVLEIDNRGQWAAIADELSARFPEISDIVRTLEMHVDDCKAAFETIHGVTRTRLGDLDIYQVFLPRMVSLIGSRGKLGVLAGGGVAKNPADEWLRVFLASKMCMQSVLHFVNSDFAFPDLPPVVEYVIMAATKGGLTTERPICRLNITSGRDLSSISHLNQFGESLPPRIFSDWLSHDGLERSGATPLTIKGFLSNLGVEFSTELHTTQYAGDLLRRNAPATDLRDPSQHSRSLTAAEIPVYGSMSLYLYDAVPQGGAGRRAKEITLIAQLCNPRIARFLPAVPFFRLAIRDTCGSIQTNARSVVGTILPAGFLTLNSLQVERSPWTRQSVRALTALAVLNSFVVDSLVRPIVGGVPIALP